MRLPAVTWRRFIRNDDGVFAVIFALMAIPVIAIGGASIDYAMWMSAIHTAQETADAAALAAAASGAESRADIETVVEGIAAPAFERHPGVVVENVSYDAVTRRVTVAIGGSIEPYFVQLVGVQSLPVVASSVAERATNGQLELALVLDNTWSMSAPDAEGSSTTKIAALKAAAGNLLTAIWDEGNENIRVGLVPYADYVNVGVSNRYQPWMNVAADTVTTKTTTTPAQPAVCTTKTTKQVCTDPPQKTCTRYVDGVPETYNCPKICETVTVPPYETCTAAKPETTSTVTTTTTWYGCVLSRTPRNLRLSDLEPATKYTGIMATTTTGRRCMNEIIPLTDNEALVRSGINSMVTNVGTSYKPATHIPSGLVWGINVLSDTQPFVQGAAYDPENIAPRKALILMTDGDNTLRFNSSNGQHIAPSGTAEQIAAYEAATDADTLALCTYAKNKKIEVFVVSFGVLQAASTTMLQGCATDEDHYFSAINAAELNEAFANIADQLRVVRIIQ